MAPIIVLSAKFREVLSLVAKLIMHKQFRGRVDQRLGVNRSFAGLNNICVDANGWLCGLLNKSHISRHELDPISVAESVRYLIAAGKLVVISSRYASTPSSCCVRTCKVTRTIENSVQNETGEFVVRAKLTPRKWRESKALTVTTRLETMAGEVVYLAVFEYELVKEAANSFLAGHLPC